MKRRRGTDRRRAERAEAQAERRAQRRLPPGSSTREARIHDEIIVDAYGGEDQVMGWYYYLERQLCFPFAAQCVATRATSPLSEDDSVTVLRMAAEEECEREMFVSVRWRRRVLAVPLAQLGAPRADDDTQKAIADWHYWVARGYEFG